MNIARIKLTGKDPQQLDIICREIKDIADKTGVDIKGPIPLPTKKLKIGKLEIIFRTAREKTLHASGKVGLVIQALKNFGKSHIDEIARARAQRFLKETSSQELKKNLKYAPQWIRDVILEVMKNKK